MLIKKKKSNRSRVPDACHHGDGWAAYWRAKPRRVKTVKFSTKKYGDTKAFELVVRAPARGLEEADGPFRDLSKGKRPTQRERTTGPELRIKRVHFTRHRLTAELLDDRVNRVVIII